MRFRKWYWVAESKPEGEASSATDIATAADVGAGTPVSESFSGPACEQHGGAVSALTFAAAPLQNGIGLLPSRLRRPN